MLATPHSLSGLGYFDQLQTSQVVAFRNVLLEIEENPSSFFSVSDRSFVHFDFKIITKQQTFSSERDVGAELDDFVDAMDKEWQQASVTVSHGTRTLNMGLKHIGAYRGEHVMVIFDNVNGVCQLSALFREGCDIRAYLLRLANALSLVEKRKKASRYMPEWLETKLLCDSMHLCNVCRETGVIIHHIIPVEEGGPSEETNLIVLCLNHHNSAHSKSILSKSLQPEHLREYRSRHLLWVAGRGAGTMSLGNAAPK